MGDAMDEAVRAVARQLRERDEAHVRAELQRLGIPEAEARERVVVLVPTNFLLRPGGLPPLPEVVTVEEYRARFAKPRDPFGLVINEVRRRTGCSTSDARAAVEAFATGDKGPEAAVEAAVKALRDYEMAPLSPFQLWAQLHALQQRYLDLADQLDVLVSRGAAGAP